MTDSSPSTATDTTRLIYVEEFSPILQQKFLKTCLVPYFSNVYLDLLLRSASSKKANPSIDKVTLTEFLQLPGILSDRIHALLASPDA